MLWVEPSAIYKALNDSPPRLSYAAPNEVKRQHEIQGAATLALDEKLLSMGTEIRFPLHLTLVQPNRGSL